jgi:hypothetical protein
MEAGATSSNGQKHDISVIDGDSGMVRRRAPVVQEGLRILKIKDEVELVDSNIKKRLRYAAMHAHRELAAAVLAVGGTRKMASRKAGVSVRQIQKYWEDPDFRERIQELQELLGNRVRGKVMKEINRRTAPAMIKKMELLDLLRVGDRFGLGRGKASAISTEVNIHNYESIFNSVFLADPEQESEDFPAFEPTSLALSGGDSPVDG